MDKKSKKGSLIILILMTLVVVFYLAGLLYQYENPPVSISNNGWDIQRAQYSFNPLKCLFYGATTSIGWKWSFIIISCIVAIIVVVKLTTAKSKNYDERNFNISTKGTYGTSGWMTPEEMAENFDIKPIKQTTGTILGMKDNKVISLPMNSKLNKHTAIYGASGTGKSRCFVRPQIIQCVARGESIIITDPKGEIYADTAQFMRNNGYTVRMFNLVNPKYSDSWNCLKEILSNPEQLELMAQTFSDVIIKNTSGAGGGGKDPFWDNAEMNLLKALSLLILTDETRDDASKSIGAVYELLTNSTEAKLTAMFDRLPNGHAAKKPWTIFKQGSDNVRGNVIISLGSRLQVFQSPDIVNITTSEEIDLELPARSKTAMFVIMSDQDSTLDFLSSLMFSFLFIRLVRYADVKGTDGKCDVPVNFILDEFPNIGQIPDFCKKLSTIRSRDLRVAVIFQNVAQLQNRYPNGLWEEIIGNCDTQLFLGCTDATTAKFISERTGGMTIEVESNSTKRKTLSPVSSNPEYGVSQSVGKREVLTPDEVMRLPNSNALVILRGQKILKVNKFDYSLHPTNTQFVHTYVRDYVPEWQKAKQKLVSEQDKDLEVTSTIDKSKSLEDKEKDRQGIKVSVPSSKDDFEAILADDKTPDPLAQAKARSQEPIKISDMENGKKQNTRPSMANERIQPKLNNRLRFNGDVDKCVSRLRPDVIESSQPQKQEKDYSYLYAGSVNAGSSSATNNTNAINNSNSNDNPPVDF